VDYGICHIEILHACRIHHLLCLDFFHTFFKKTSDYDVGNFENKWLLRAWPSFTVFGENIVMFRIAEVMRAEARTQK
jgi:hypothetical protein